MLRASLNPSSARVTPIFGGSQLRARLLSPASGLVFACPGAPWKNEAGAPRVRSAQAFKQIRRHLWISANSRGAQTYLIELIRVMARRGIPTGLPAQHGEKGPDVLRVPTWRRLSRMQFWSLAALRPALASRSRGAPHRYPLYALPCSGIRG